MADRYALSDQRTLEEIEDIVSPLQRMGRPRRNDCQILDGVFLILCPGNQ